VESLAAVIGRRHEISVCALRYAVVAGSHVPSPLGRVLRLPTVPVPALADPPFSLLDRDDAARAMVEALLRGHEGPLNVVGPGATSPWQATRFGNRLPMPVQGLGWRFARRTTEFLGAPMPDHVVDVLRKGLTGDGSRAYDELGLGFVRPTQEVLADLYAWATVTSITDVARKVA
jgi:UDP-glucose 4-epimerase